MKLNGKQIRLCIKIKWSENKIFAFEARKWIRHQKYKHQLNSIYTMWFFEPNQFDFMFLAGRL